MTGYFGKIDTIYSVKENPNCLFMFFCVRIGKLKNIREKLNNNFAS